MGFSSLLMFCTILLSFIDGATASWWGKTKITHTGITWECSVKHVNSITNSPHRNCGTMVSEDDGKTFIMVDSATGKHATCTFQIHSQDCGEPWLSHQEKLLRQPSEPQTTPGQGAPGPAAAKSASAEPKSKPRKPANAIKTEPRKLTPDKCLQRAMDAGGFSDTWRMWGVNY